MNYDKNPPSYPGNYPSQPGFVQNPGYPQFQQQSYPNQETNYPAQYQQYPAQYQQYPTQPTNVYPGVQPAVVIPATNLSTSVIMVGGNCPNCHMGVLTEDFDCCGICLAIVFFPIGVLCCLAMRKKVCSHCRTEFG